MVCCHGACEDERDSERVQGPTVTLLAGGSSKMRLEKASWPRRVSWHAGDGGLGGLERDGRISARCKGRGMTWQLGGWRGKGGRRQDSQDRGAGGGETGRAQPGKESLKVSWRDGGSQL